MLKIISVTPLEYTLKNDNKNITPYPTPTKIKLVPRETHYKAKRKFDFNLIEYK